MMKVMTMTMETKTMAATCRCLPRCRSRVDCCLRPRHRYCHQCRTINAAAAAAAAALSQPLLPTRYCRCRRAAKLAAAATALPS
jgi:hypothetical protein